MTYNVFGGTLNLARSTRTATALEYVCQSRLLAATVHTSHAAGTPAPTPP